jgi:hypothetical protein
MKFCDWLPGSLLSNGVFPLPHSVRPVRIFPLSALYWLYGALVSRLQKITPQRHRRWHGLRLLAADKTTLSLPETKSLWKRFGAHKGQQGLGPIAIELCCLFDLVSRAPLRFVFDKVCTSEHKLIKKLILSIKKNDLLLIDSGFYSCTTFVKIIRRKAHFIIPATKTMSPKVLRNLGQSEYLCKIENSRDHSTLTVRVLFVYRNGFRRRRLVTSLLDSVTFPASEIARLYHLRWDIETFYRDFKQTFKAMNWHCRMPTSFHQELIIHMIAFCLIRLAMVEAGCLAKVYIGQLSFARALTETRLFFTRLSADKAVVQWAIIWMEYVQCCALHRVRSKPNRQFPRDKQEYRKKSRGLERKRRGRKPAVTKKTSVMEFRPETLQNSKGQAYLLS